APQRTPRTGARTPRCDGGRRRGVGLDRVRGICQKPRLREGRSWVRRSAAPRWAQVMATTTAPTTRSRAWQFRAPRRPRLLWQVPVFFAGLLALAGVCVARPLWRAADVNLVDRELAAARELVRQADCPVPQVKAHAERALSCPGIIPQQAGEAHFLLGS